MTFKFKIILLLPLLFINCSEDQKDIVSKTAEGTMKLIPSSQSRVTFNNAITETYDLNQIDYGYMYNGGGVAVGDLNNDGLSDIYFSGNIVEDKVYINKGDFKFEDITKSSGIDGLSGWHTGVTMVDINHDGYQDIYVCRGGWKDGVKLMRNQLWINQKNETFIDEAALYGIDDPGYSTHANFFDADNDGDLDLYVGNHRNKWGNNLARYSEMIKENDPKAEDHLYFNNGDFTFTDVSKKAGIKDDWNFPLSITTCDVNNDGYLDIYVASDFSYPDFCWVNQKDGTFKDQISEHFNHSAYFAMGTDVADINNDGYEDIFTTEMLPEDYWRAKVTMAPMVDQKGFEYLYDKLGFHHQYMQNVLQMNNGNGFFSEISQMAGLQHTDWSWACLFVDFNNDMKRDLFIANGYKRDVFDNDANKTLNERLEKLQGKPRGEWPDIQELLTIRPSNPLPNYVYINESNLNFQPVGEIWGMDQASFSNGAAHADLDNDGDLDLIVNNIDLEAFIYENRISEKNYLRIDLKGRGKNIEGLGAKVSVKVGDQTMTELFKTVRGYNSSVEPILHFGMDNFEKADQIIVEWLGGEISKLENVAVNQLIKIDQAQSTRSDIAQQPIKPFLTEKTELISPPFKHTENEFLDYSKQVLLPHKQSANGPYLSVGDVNGDKLADFFIGGASRQSGCLYLQSKNGFEKKQVNAFVDDQEFEDMGAAFLDYDLDGDLDLYVSSGGSEFGERPTMYQDRLYKNDGEGNFTRSNDLPVISVSSSCVKINDFDNDGDMDVFVGGRILPDYYPHPTNSYLLENKEGKLIDATKARAPELINIGLVTDAVWSDVDGDEVEDLIVTGEWMPIKVLLNQDGQFYDNTEEYGLNKTVGWWNSLLSHDFDDDGINEIVAGNLGTNYKFHASEEKPFHVYSNDFDKNGTYDVFLAKVNGDRQVPIRGRSCSSEQIPDIKENFKTYREFAESNIAEILGDGFNDALHYEATMFESVSLKFNNNLSNITALPKIAQISTVKDLVSIDINQDGIKDIIGGGNMFGSEAETTRADASVGFSLLSNKNQKELQSLSTAQSGLFIPYDVRAIEVIKVNGKEHILVASNNDKLRLFVVE